MSFKEKTLDFFRSYKGLIALITLYETLIVSFLATFSGPMVDRFGNMPILEYIFPLIKGLPAERHDARAIMLYHAVAIPFLAVVVYMYMDKYKVRPKFEDTAKWSIFIGAMTASISAMIFAYFSPSNWVWHGLFIAGQAIIFFGGIFFLLGIWPTKTFPGPDEPGSDVTIMGLNFEYFNLSITTIALLISASIAAYAASFFGREDTHYVKWLDKYGINGKDPGLVQNGINHDVRYFKPVLLEEVVRRSGHNAGYTFYEMVVTHLHIMLALLAGAIMLYSIRYTNMQGKSYKWMQILYLPGIVILSVGAWLVITPWEYAHDVINAGASFLLLVGIYTAVYAWIEISKNQLGDDYANASIIQKILAVFKDPVRFALYFQLIWVDVVSAAPGIYVGINLREGRNFRDFLMYDPNHKDVHLPIYNTANLRMIDVEYAFNVGHWHILATLIAMMMLLILVDYYGVKDVWRTIIGWAVFFGTVIGFSFANFYMLRNPDNPVPSVEFDFLMIDIGLALLFLGVGVLAIFILIAYIKGKLASAAKE